MHAPLRTLLTAFFLAFLTACGGDQTDEAIYVHRTAAEYNSYVGEIRLAGPEDICIVTQFTSNMDEFSLIAVDNHQAYAWRHGYNAFAFRGRISGAAFSDPEQSERLRRDGLYWQKLAAVQRVLSEKNVEQTTPLCQWVMWLDGDAIFTNFERAIESVLAPYSDKDVVLSREYEYSVINAGVFFVRNSDKGREFVRNVAGMYATHKDRGLPEQEAIQDYAFQHEVPAYASQDYDSDLLPRLRPEIGVAPQRTFNSFAGVCAGENVNASWQPCDFVAHIAGARSSVRAALMKEMMQGRERCAP